MNPSNPAPVGDERTQFEAYYAKFGRVMGGGRFVQYIDPDDESLTHYLDPLVGEAWHIWQAARASTVQQVGADALHAARYRSLQWVQTADSLGPIFRADVRRTEATLFNVGASIDAAIASSPKSDGGKGS